MDTFESLAERLDDMIVNANGLDVYQFAKIFAELANLLRDKLDNEQVAALECSLESIKTKSETTEWFYWRNRIGERSSNFLATEKDTRIEGVNRLIWASFDRETPVTESVIEPIIYWSEISEISPSALKEVLQRVLPKFIS
jgi:hypothetical protein